MTITLIQGDTEDIKIQLSEAGNPVNLTNFTVSFTMESDSGEKITIDCLKGYTDISTTPATVYTADNGYITLPITETDSAAALTYKGQIRLTNSGLNRTWPLDYDIIVKIRRSILPEVIT